MKGIIVTVDSKFFIVLPVGYTTSDALTNALTTAQADNVGLSQFPANDCFFIPATSATGAQTICDTINANLP